MTAARPDPLPGRRHPGKKENAEPYHGSGAAETSTIRLAPLP